MDVLFFADDPDPQPWAEALRRALPHGSVHEWAPGNAPQCDYAVCWKPPAAFFAGQPRLKAILNIGAGADALLSDPNLPAHVPVIRLDDAGMAAQMEEYVAWCALTFLRRMHDYANLQAAQSWERLAPCARDTFTIGIMGMGVLGQRVASFMRDLGFPVRGWSLSGRTIDGVKSFAGTAALDAFLAETRLLVCLLPLTAMTRGILGRETLSKLPSGAYLVNIARGGHMVEEEILGLLDSGHLAGAALDVFPVEPLPAASALWRHPKVVVTPHVSAMTLIDESMTQIATKIMGLERGAAVVGVIDRDRGY